MRVVSMLLWPNRSDSLTMSRHVTGARIADGATGIEAELASHGLQVVHTRPELVGEVSYTQPKAPGRPRPVLPPVEAVEMIQVETKKDAS